MERKWSYKNISADFPKQYKVTDQDGKYIMQVSESPTGNCQIFSIGEIRSLLRLPKNEALVELRKIHGLISYVPQLLCDVHSDETSELEYLFKDAIVVWKQPFISSNDSRMVSYLIRVDQMLKL